LPFSNKILNFAEKIPDKPFSVPNYNLDIEKFYDKIWEAYSREYNWFFIRNRRAQEGGGSRSPGVRAGSQRKGEARSPTNSSPGKMGITGKSPGLAPSVTKIGKRGNSQDKSAMGSHPSPRGDNISRFGR
jgi:hypothetical protein